MVSYVVYGRGCFDQLDEIVSLQRQGEAPMIFLVDHFFENKPLISRIPLRGRDKIIYADVSFLVTPDRGRPGGPLTGALLDPPLELRRPSGRPSHLTRICA